MEPEDLWTSRLPKRLAERAPRTERGEKYEIAYIDGQQINRQLNDFAGTRPSAVTILSR
ncbi:amidohydrolase 2 domain protein [Mycobacterium xenopi 4042]|uniref:Amidohydrolase 2 domain protein n=1 Tax=Mycobacterium xenopi 4042 TaxID=1299334 RepID=X7ZYA1_MYCXE|nr:amidohydrolase 2 domain protein [Mycobacterium xenopi 4042]